MSIMMFRSYVIKCDWRGCTQAAGHFPPDEHPRPVDRVRKEATAAGWRSRYPMPTTNVANMGPAIVEVDLCPKHAEMTRDV